MGDQEQFYVLASTVAFQIDIQLLSYWEHQPLLGYLALSEQDNVTWQGSILVMCNNLIFFPDKF